MSIHRFAMQGWRGVDQGCAWEAPQGGRIAHARKRRDHLGKWQMKPAYPPRRGARISVGARRLQEDPRGTVGIVRSALGSRLAAAEVVKRIAEWNFGRVPSVDR